MEELRCQSCKKEFSLKKNLHQHIRQVHEQQKKYECGICQKTFSRKYHKNMHLRTCFHRVSKSNDGEPVVVVAGNTSVMRGPVEAADGCVTLPVIKKRSTGGGITRETMEIMKNEEKREPKLKFTPILRQSAFGGCFADWFIKFPEDYQQGVDLMFLLTESTIAMKDIILDTLWTHTKSLKFTMAAHVVFEKAVDPEIKTDPPVVLHTEPSTVYVSTDMNECLNEMARQLYAMIETYEGNGSGWVFDCLLRLDTNITSFVAV